MRFGPGLGSKEIVVTKAWDEKGCVHCRNIWLTTVDLPELAVNLREHTSLHQCPVCETYWEMHERFVDVTSRAKARKKYPDAFKE